MRQYGRREFLKVAGLVLAASSVGILSGCGDSGSGSGAGNGSSSGNGGDSGNAPGGDSSGTDPEPGGDSSETPSDPTQVQPVFTKINGSEVRFDCFRPGTPTPVGTYKLPSVWEGVPVTRINVSAFAECREITKIILPQTITEIGRSAFIDCSNLKEIELPSTVRSIGACAFQSCTSLQKIAIPKNKELHVIPNRLFSACPALQAVYLPDTIIRIEANAFESVQADHFTIFYGGTPEQWAAVTIDPSAHVQFKKVTPHYNATPDNLKKFVCTAD